MFPRYILVCLRGRRCGSVVLAAEPCPARPNAGLFFFGRGAGSADTHDFQVLHVYGTVAAAAWHLCAQPRGPIDRFSLAHLCAQPRGPIDRFSLVHLCAQPRGPIDRFSLVHLCRFKFRSRHGFEPTDLTAGTHHDAAMGQGGFDKARFCTRMAPLQQLGICVLSLVRSRSRDRCSFLGICVLSLALSRS
jgi:hypothetical protein